MGVVLWADVSDEEVIGFQRAHWRVLTRRLDRSAVERSVGEHGKSMGLVLAPWLVVCEASACGLLEWQGAL